MHRFRELRLEIHSKLLSSFINRSLRQCKSPAERWKVLKRQGIVGKRNKAVYGNPDKFARFLLDLPGSGDPVNDLRSYVKHFVQNSEETFHFVVYF